MAYLIEKKIVDLFILMCYNKITIKKERFKTMTREQAKQKLDENCKKAHELYMCVITFFAVDMITHEIYSLTGFFDSGFEAMQWVRSKMVELDKLSASYLCYMGNRMYLGCADFKFDED